MQTAVIIAVFNEAESLTNLLPKLPRENFDYFLIDDGSKDESVKIAQNFGFKVIKQEQNLGKPKAVKRGFEEMLKNNYDTAIVFDGDGQHPIWTLEEMKKLLLEHQIVKAKRVQAEDQIPVDRRVVMVGMQAIIKELTGWDLIDPCCGLVGLQREILEKVFPVILFDKSWEIELIMRLWDLNCPIYQFSIPAIYNLQTRKQQKKYRDDNLENRMNRLTREATKAIEVYKEAITGK